MSRQATHSVACVHGNGEDLVPDRRVPGNVRCLECGESRAEITLAEAVWVFRYCVAFEPPAGTRWPHDSCGEAGSYCDHDCHGHEHTVLWDGSVVCHEASEDPEEWLEAQWGGHEPVSLGEALGYA